MIVIVNICIEINLEDSLPNSPRQGRRWQTGIRSNFRFLNLMLLNTYFFFFNKKPNYHNNIQGKSEGFLEKPWKIKLIFRRLNWESRDILTQGAQTGGFIRLPRPRP